MKYILLLLCFLYALTGCDERKLSHQEIVTKYYEARDALNYNKAMTCVNDSLTVVAGDFVMPYNQDNYYEVFKWDSIFQPSYEIVELEEKDNQVIASVTLKSLRNEFLKNSTMTCEYKISFIAGKISKIESLECKDADWDSWQKEVNSLVNWVKINQPQLDGFINDLTMNGAINYLKAIELYKNR